MTSMLYVALLTVFYIGLSAYVIKGRFAYRVSLGDGGEKDLNTRIRAHANFAEYAPLAILLLFLVDYAEYANWMVHALGLTLLAGRLLHAAGLVSGNRGRPAGMVLTFLMMLISAILLVVDYLNMQMAGL